MTDKKPDQASAKQKAPVFSDEALVAFCGINCKACKTRSERRIQLAKLFKEALQELPLDLFKEIFPPFKNIDQVMECLSFSLKHSARKLVAHQQVNHAGTLPAKFEYASKITDTEPAQNAQNIELAQNLIFLNRTM
jgi:hypothetical protein